MRRKKLSFSVVSLILMIIIGVSLLLYPTISNYWNSLHQSKAIAAYIEKVKDATGEKARRLFLSATAYNQKLVGSSVPRLNLTTEEIQEYKKQLNITPTGVMAYIEIPKIKERMPIYHGVDDSILQVAIGHIPGTSLPVGGKGTHAVTSGHRGLPSANLFTNIDKLTKGDFFKIHILNRVLTYEVDQILVVKPEDITALAIDPDKDYHTLVTCTPYGVNTHRLLVRGHRIFKEKENSEVINKSTRQHPVLHLILITGGTILFITFALVYFQHRRRQLKMKVY